MGNTKRIFLDLDGPLGDMVGAVLRRLKTPDSFSWPVGVWDLPATLGMSPKELWGKLSDHEFWADEIRPTPWARELVDTAIELVGLENVSILTRPLLSPFSASGKLAWIQTHFPELSRQYHLSVDKTDISGPGRVLVDDSPDNVALWRGAGGLAVLWPVAQNSRYADTPEMAMADLRQLFKV